MFGLTCFDILEDQRLGDKATEVVLSCETVEQYLTAQAYLRLAKRKAKLRVTVDYLDKTINEVHKMIMRLGCTIKPERGGDLRRWWLE